MGGVNRKGYFISSIINTFLCSNSGCIFADNGNVSSDLCSLLRDFGIDLGPVLSQSQKGKAKVPEANAFMEVDPPICNKVEEVADIGVLDALEVDLLLPDKLDNNYAKHEEEYLKDEAIFTDNGEEEVVSPDDDNDSDFEVPASLKRATRRGKRYISDMSNSKNS